MSKIHISPDAVLPEQMPESKDTASNNPIHKLMLCMLEEALTTFQKGIRSPVPEQQRRSLEVETWIYSTDESWPFSFENICATLKMNPDYIRTGIGRLRAEVCAGKRDGNKRLARLHNERRTNHSIGKTGRKRRTTRA